MIQRATVFRMIAWIWLVLRTFFVDPTTLLKKSRKKKLEMSLFGPDNFDEL